MHPIVSRRVIRGDTLDGAIAATVCYLDVFACAPRASEIHRFLIGHKATRAQVEDALANSADLTDLVGEKDGLYYLRGKPHLVPRRIRFFSHGDNVWARARKMADKLERSGLATCGLVTGSLAADNADEHADIDFLLIYPAHRAWSSYAAVRLVAKLPVFEMSGLCPNYALPDDKLTIRPQNLFTAWEVAKAVPLFGFDVYQRFVLANRWIADLLPNALPMLDAAGPEPSVRPQPRLARLLTKNPAFDWLENRERARKFARDTKDVGVDMNDRFRRGSVDRHAPTRSFQALCELRYRMEMFGLGDHPLYGSIAEWTSLLDDEMRRWGTKRLQRGIGAAREVTAL